MTAEQIEQKIQDKGLNAPRVTPRDVEGEIASIHFFTAAQGAQKANDDRAFHNGGVIDTETHKPPQQLELLTICVLVLNNGFTVTGESACASPENFNPDIGKDIAFDKAREKIWPLLGFRLRDRLHSEALNEASPTS